jgi:quercetin dioxygenase-like cupin family protein
MVGWEIKTLKDTLRERIVLVNLESKCIYPEERNTPRRVIIVAVDGSIEVLVKIGPAKNKTLLNKGDSIKVSVGCWYEISNAAKDISRFILIEQEDVN